MSEMNKSSGSKKKPDEIDWSLPLLSGANLNIVFEQCKRLHDLKQEKSKKHKFVPNLCYARESKPEVSVPKPSPIIPKEVPAIPTNEPEKPPTKKRNLFQQEGLNIFGDCSNDNKSSTGLKYKKSIESFKVNDEISNENLKSIMTVLNVEDRKPADFRNIYKNSKQYDRKYVPNNNLPFGLPYHEESKKTIYQKIQEIESPEDYDNMYFNTVKLSNALRLHSNETKNTPATPIFLLQLPGILPSLIRRMPEYEGEEEVSITDDIGRVITGYPCTLENLPEGKVGTLQILKSGRMKLKLGECEFWLTKGMETGIQEEAMLIDINNIEKSGTAYKLGDVDSHIVAMPDFLTDGKFNELLEDCDNSNTESEST